jgi:hypothetical protein
MSTIINATTTNGVVIQPDNSGSLQLATNSGTTAVTIDTSQNVGIGTTSPSTWSGAKLVAATSTSTSSQVVIENLSYATGQTIGIDFTVAGGSKQAFTRAVVENGSTAATALTFGTASGGNNVAERMRIDSSGIVTGTAGNLMLVHQGVVTLSSTSTTLTTTIPTWAKRVTLVCNGATQNSTAHLLIRLNSITTGYSSICAVSNTGAAVVSSTAGFIIYGAASNFGFTGSMTLHNQTGNTWVQSHTGAAFPFTPTTGVYGGGSIALAAALSTISVTTTTGTPTLSGSISVLYE